VEAWLVDLSGNEYRMGEAPTFGGTMFEIADAADLGTSQGDRLVHG
jgi:hypothetical protein